MKNLLLIPSLTLVLSLSATSCGKKPQDNSPVPKPQTVQEKVGPGLIEETHRELRAAIIAKDVAAVRRILVRKEQIDLNKRLSDGETLMTTAVIINNPQIVEILLENNTSLSKTNKNNETPIMVAARMGHDEMVKRLISLGATTNDKDGDGNTALHLAILSSKESIALYLINNKTNIEIRNNENQSPLKLAETIGLKKVVELLKSLTQVTVGLPERESVRRILTSGNTLGLEQILAQYPTITSDYKDLNFYVLAMRGQSHDVALSMTYLLMSHGASLTGPIDAEATPMIEAIKKGYADFVALILKEKVDPNTLDSDGTSPLIWAIRLNQPAIVKILIDHGAKKNYFYYKDGNKRPVHSCMVTRSQKKDLMSDFEKEDNDLIMKYLDCSLRRFF